MKSKIAVQDTPITIMCGPILSLSETCNKLIISFRALPKSEEQEIDVYIGGSSGQAQFRYGPFISSLDNDYMVKAEIYIDDKINPFEYWIETCGHRRLTRIFKPTIITNDTTDFIAYFASDSHDQNDEWPLSIKEHYENLQASGDTRPAVVIYGGDMLQLPAPNNAEFVASKYKNTLNNTSIKRLFSEIPMLYQFDDHDWGGNNSCETHAGEQGEIEINRDMLMEMRNRYVPSPAKCIPDHNGWFCNIGDTLILAPDSRSRKTPLAIFENECHLIMDGTGQEPVWGDSQLGWMLDILHRYKDVKRVLFLSTQTFVDNLSAPIPYPCSGPVMGCRDSIGIWHKHERNSLLRLLKHLNYFESETKFIVLSGDDHIPLIRRRDFWYRPYDVINRLPEIDEDLDMAIWEFKAGNGHSTTRIFDSIEHPPKWWGRSGDDYGLDLDWGVGNSVGVSIGFCFELSENKIAISGLLLEDETYANTYPPQLPRKAPYQIFRKIRKC